MKNLFYFPDQRTLCWVVGYCGSDSTTNVFQKIGILNEKANEFARMLDLDSIQDIDTYFVVESNRYKYNRVYYTTCDSSELPEGTIVMVDDLGKQSFKTFQHWLK